MYYLLYIFMIWSTRKSDNVVFHMCSWWKFSIHIFFPFLNMHKIWSKDSCVCIYMCWGKKDLPIKWYELDIRCCMVKAWALVRFRPSNVVNWWITQLTQRDNVKAEGGCPALVVVWKPKGVQSYKRCVFCFVLKTIAMFDVYLFCVLLYPNMNVWLV